MLHNCVTFICYVMLVSSPHDSGREVRTDTVLGHRSDSLGVEGEIFTPGLTTVSFLTPGTPSRPSPTWCNMDALVGVLRREPFLSHSGRSDRDSVVHVTTEWRWEDVGSRSGGRDPSGETSDRHVSDYSGVDGALLSGIKLMNWLRTCKGQKHF